LTSKVSFPRGEYVYESEISPLRRDAKDHFIVGQIRCHPSVPLSADTDPFSGESDTVVQVELAAPRIL
jgi:hypothetical protein